MLFTANKISKLGEQFNRLTDSTEWQIPFEKNIELIPMHPLNNLPVNILNLSHLLMLAIKSVRETDQVLQYGRPVIFYRQSSVVFTS